MKSIFFLALIMNFLLCSCAHPARRQAQVKAPEIDGERVVEVSPTPTPADARDPFDSQVDATGWPKRP